MTQYDIENWVMKSIQMVNVYNRISLLNLNDFIVQDNVIKFKTKSNIRIFGPFPEDISLDSTNIKSIHCHFYTYKIPVDNFRGWPTSINGNLVLSYNTINSFEFMPNKIKGDIWFLGSKVASFRHFTQEIDKIKGGAHLENVYGYNTIKFISSLHKY